MVMKRTKQPWMKAETFGRSLPGGIGINLLVPEIEPMEGFLRSVLSARTIYADEDFAAIELGGALMMLHADHSYADHEMAGVVDGAELRGLGVEIRVYGLDPDQAEQAARRPRPRRACRRRRQAAWPSRMPSRGTGRLCVRAEPASAAG